MSTSLIRTTTIGAAVGVATDDADDFVGNRFTPARFKLGSDA